MLNRSFVSRHARTPKVGSQDPRWNMTIVSAEVIPFEVLSMVLLASLLYVLQFSRFKKEFQSSFFTLYKSNGDLFVIKSFQLCSFSAVKSTKASGNDASLVHIAFLGILLDLHFGADFSLLGHFFYMSSAMPLTGQLVGMF